MKNRSRTDLIASILEVIYRGGSTKTKIMYGAFMSYDQLNEYMSFILEAGLIESQMNGHSHPSFKLTEKGRHFLDLQNQMNEMVTMIKSK